MVRYGHVEVLRGTLCPNVRLCSSLGQDDTSLQRSGMLSVFSVLVHQKLLILLLVLAAGRLWRQLLKQSHGCSRNLVLMWRAGPGCEFHKVILYWIPVVFQSVATKFPRHIVLLPCTAIGQVHSCT